MNQPKSFQQIAISFDANMRALSVFSQHIGGFADEYDKKLVQSVIEELATIFDIAPSELEKEIIGQPIEDGEVEVEEIVAKGEEIQFKVRGKIESSFNSRDFTEWATRNRDKAEKIIGVMKYWGRHLPAQGILLRRGTLVTLVSQFEILLAELIGVFYLLYPSELSPEKSLKLSELRTFETIQDAELSFINKEVEAITRGGLSKSIDFFRTQKVDLRVMQEILATLAEIFQRRNTFVHNNGVVDQNYLAKVDSVFIQNSGIELNSRLRISPQYLQKAIEMIWLGGIFLIQQCWRKWAKDEHKLADKTIADFMYDTLLDEQYGLTLKAAQLTSKIKISEPQETIILINHAIALRELGDYEKMKKLAKGINATTGPHKMARHIFLDEVDKAFELLPGVIEEAGYDRERMKEWPLFKHLKDDRRFISAFEGLNGNIG